MHYNSYTTYTVKDDAKYGYCISITCSILYGHRGFCVINNTDTQITNEAFFFLP